MSIYYYLPNSRREILFFCTGIITSLFIVLLCNRFEEGSVVNNASSFDSLRDIPVPMVPFPEKCMKVDYKISRGSNFLHV